MTIIKFLKIFFLFISLLYCLLPFETNPVQLSILIRLIFAIIITFYALHVGNYTIRKNTLAGVLFTLLFILAFISFFLNTTSLYFPIFVGSVIFAAITANMITNNHEFNKQFITAFQWLLIFSIAMLFLQKAIYASSGVILPLHEMFFPLSEARTPIQTTFSDIARLGGIYIEPGTYANFMYTFLIIYLLISKNISSPLLFIGAISLPFTFSVWGMVFGSYLLVILTISNLKRLSGIKRVLALSFIFITSSFTVGYFLDSPAIELAIYKLDKNSESEALSSKTKAHDEFSENFQDYLLIGGGFKTDFCSSCESWQDSGIFLNLFVVFGIFSSIIIFIIYMTSWLSNGEWLGFIASLPIFVSKLFYFDFSFWLLVFLAIHLGSNKIRSRTTDQSQN